MIQCRNGDVPRGCLLCVGSHLLKFKGNFSSYKNCQVQVTIVFWGAVQKFKSTVKRYCRFRIKFVVQRRFG